MSSPSASVTRRRLRVRRCTSLLAALVLAGATACGGGGDSPGPTTPTPGTLAVSLASFPASIVAGSQSTVGISITRGGGFTGAVSLAVEGAPAGVTASLSATTLGAGETTATLTLQVGTTVAAGSYPITIRATGTGVSAATASSTLLVTAAPVPSFALTASPAAISVVAGQQGTSTITITRGGGFTGNVTLVAEGAPAGVTGSFSVSPVTGTSTTLTLAVSASTAAGTYPITVRGTGTGVAEQTATVTLTVAAAPNFSIALAPAAATLATDDNVDVTVNITRTGGFTGAVEFVTSALPAGVVATFIPRSTTAASTSVSLRTSPLTPVGTYEIIFRGTGAGVGDRQATFTLTVRAGGDISLALTPSSATVTAGGTTNPTVTIQRAGGFTGAVALSATGAPAGVSVSFAPASATGAVSSMTITTTAGTAPGTYPITIRGNAAGLEERTATFSLTVQSGGGGGTGNVIWQFCDTERFPLWFAFRDGLSGTWTRVLPGANQTYGFTVNSDRAAVAYVFQGGGTSTDVFVFLHTRAELQALGAAECQTNPATKTLNGSVTGLTPPFQSATINVTGSSTTASANGAFVITGVDAGVVDLFAARATLDLGTLSSIPDRFVLRRGFNIANNGTMPVVDFGGAESFAPATATYTIANGGGDAMSVTTGFTTSNGAAGFFTFGPISSTAATRTVYGVPTARTQSGDLHQVFVTAVSGTTSARVVSQYNRELADRTLTLGPSLSAPTISSLGSGPYPRLRAAGSWQNDYDQGVGITYTQTSGSGRSWSVTASAGYFGSAASYELDIPDLSAVSGFNPLWALQGGSSATWSMSASKIENAPIGVAVENFRLKAASRSGSVTP